MELTSPNTEPRQERTPATKGSEENETRVGGLQALHVLYGTFVRISITMVGGPLFEATDCACSSLACNPFQVSCCLPTAASKPSVRTHHADWMGRLGKINRNIKFRDLILIGAHDSASFSVGNNQPMSAVAKCQNFDTTQQLHAGVRILDIRMATGESAKSRIAIWHGCVQGGDLVETVLNPVRDFVDRYPQEIIVLHLVPEYSRDFSLEQKKRALMLVKDTLGAKILHGGHMSDLSRSWTLGDVQDRPGARVIVLVHDRFFAKKVDPRFNESSLLEEYGFAPMAKWLRCLWFNTRDKDALLDYALDDVKRYGRQKKQFHASQLVLTPGVGGFVDVLAAIIGINKLRPASLAYRLYGSLGPYLREHASEGWNWVLLDFVDLGPWIVHFLTALNFPIQFKLHLALYQNESGKTTPGINVTPQLQTCVCRSRVFFIEDFRTILGLPADAKGTLTLVYTLGKETQVALVNMDKESGVALLLSGFGNSCDADAITTIPNDQPHGYIHNGGVLLQNTDAAKLMGTVLEFAFDSDGVFSCQLFSAKNKIRSLDIHPIPKQIVMTTEATPKYKVLVLISNHSFDRNVLQNQKNAITILESKRISYETLDGSDTENKESRNELFALSKHRGKYPQFFLLNENGSKAFWGDMEAFNIANEEGRLSAELGGDSRAATPPEFTMLQDKINIEPAAPAEPAPSSDRDSQEILLLISQQSLDRTVVQNQQNVMTVLDSKGIKYEALDGANPANKSLRNELFSLSEKRGKYPQIFLVKDRRKQFWGDMDTFHDANEMGVLANALGGGPTPRHHNQSGPPTINERSEVPLASPVKASDDAPTVASQKEISSEPPTSNGHPEITVSPPAPAVMENPIVLVLISRQSLDRTVVQDQEKALHTLTTMGINFTTIDGTDPENKEVRNELFSLSGLRAIYPQFFVVHSNGTKTFWGGMGVFEASNEGGTLQNDLADLST